jgi:hypothetical protein
MNSTSDDHLPFDPDNQAWRHFLALAGEHFELLLWQREDGRPVIVTLTDVPSGDGISLGVLDSAEQRDPHAVLVLRYDGHTSAHGPVPGPVPARRHMLRLGLTHTRGSVTAVFALHDPAEPELPATAWSPPLPAISPQPTGTPVGSTPAAAILVDNDDRVAVAGPFPTADAAGAWRPSNINSTDIQVFVVPMHPTEPGQ